MSGGRGVRGNREVSPLFLLRSGGGGRIAATSEATSKEGGSWGKHGFPPRERAEGEGRSCHTHRRQPRLGEEARGIATAAERIARENFHCSFARRRHPTELELAECT